MSSDINSNMVIPKHIQLETVHKICDAKCTMCDLNMISGKPSIMSNENFIEILNKFKNYKNEIDYVTLVGFGESLLDKDIVKKVAITKKMGFKGVGFPTNCIKLDEEMSTNLIKAGIDTIICGIDGFTKKTHESIRVGTNFENITSNVKNLIKIRNKLNNEDNNIRTKILIRFIYQKSNMNEWSEFYNYWLSFLNKDFGDDVLKFNIHDWEKTLKTYENIYNDKDFDDDKLYENYICPDASEKIIILLNGEVNFCCQDVYNSYKLGNVFYEDPITIFNNKMYTHYRKAMSENKILELELCKDCSIMKSRIESKQL